MSKTHIDIDHLAHLARIHLEPAEAKQLQGQVESILGYVEQLQTIDTTGIEETAQVTGLMNVFRADELRPSGDDHAVDLLAAAPDLQDGFIKVPVVLTEE